MSRGERESERGLTGAEWGERGVDWNRLGGRVTRREPFLQSRRRRKENQKRRLDSNVRYGSRRFRMLWTAIVPGVALDVVS